jgi:hypothetical protein
MKQSSDGFVDAHFLFRMDNVDVATMVVINRVGYT